MASNCYFDLRPTFWSHCINSPESKAQLRYDSEYIIDGLLPLSVHIFKEVYLRCDQISCKAHKEEERLHTVFGLTGSLVAMGNIKLP